MSEPWGQVLILASKRQDLTPAIAVGFELSAVQAGLMPSDFKPMSTVGPGAYEIRVNVEGEWRVIYVAKFARAVYALHAFHKKSQKTRQEDIEIARTRYGQAKEAEK